MKEVIINTMVLIYIRYSKSATKNRCSCISHNNHLSGRLAKSNQACSPAQRRKVKVTRMFPSQNISSSPLSQITRMFPSISCSGVSRHAMRDSSPGTVLRNESHGPQKQPHGHKSQFSLANQPHQRHHNEQHNNNNSAP